MSSFFYIVNLPKLSFTWLAFCSLFSLRTQGTRLVTLNSFAKSCASKRAAPKKWSPIAFWNSCCAPTRWRYRPPRVRNAPKSRKRTPASPRPKRLRPRKVPNSKLANHPTATRSPPAPTTTRKVVHPLTQLGFVPVPRVFTMIGLICQKIVKVLMGILPTISPMFIFYYQ